MTTGWERLAAFEGGSVADLAAAQAADGAWHVFAATPVGVFRSVDRGQTWAPLGTGRRVAGAEVVQASPRYAEDGLVYVGAHDGVYRLQGTDASWQQVLTGCVAHCIALDAGDRDARPDGGGLTVFVGTQADGILVSRNGGRTWEGANAGLLSLHVYDLALSPSFGVDGIAFAALSDGLYRTRNGAESWRQLDTDTEDALFDAVAISPTFSEDRLVLADCYDAGLLRSEDGGRTWSLIDLRDPAEEDAAADDEPQYGNFGDIFGLAFLSGERAAAWTELGVAVSADGGQSWRLDWERQTAQGVSQVTSGVHLPTVEAAPVILLAGTAQNGVYRSDDGGATWTPSARGLHAVLVSDLLLSPRFPTDQTLFTPSIGSDPQLSTDAGRAWRTIQLPDQPGDDDDDEAATDADGAHVAGAYDAPRLAAVIPSPEGGRMLVGATLYGVALSDDDGAHWRPAWTGTPFATAEPPIQQSVHALATATTTGGAHLLADIASERGMERFLVGSRDGGQTWTEIPTPNKRAFVRGLALTPGAGLDGPLYVAVHKNWDGDLTLWRSADGGRRWQVWYADPELKRDVATPFVALPANAFGDTVVLALGGCVLRPRPNAWEVKEGVRRPVWDAVELADEEQPGRTVAIAGLAASPAYAQDRTLFAATSAGVYVSRDGGASFGRWSDGPEPAATVAVAVSPAYAQDRLVYALGLGGSVWRRTDR